MFPNLEILTNSPIARTNLIQLNEEPLETINRLLVPISNLYAIDFFIQHFAKKRKEAGSDYFIRIHREVKQHLRHVLGLDASEDVKYELHRLGSGQYICFYLAPLDTSNRPPHLSLSVRIEQLCQKLTAEEHSLNRLVQGLFGLHLKMLLLEKTRERFEIEPVYFNAEIYLNARLSQPVSAKQGTGIMEAFELDIFASEQRELAFTLHKCKFLVEPANELYLTLVEEQVWFNTDSGKVKARRRLDARDTSLNFFEERSAYGACQAYTYNLVMNAAVDRLTDLEIPHTPLPFQATYEVNQFATDLDQVLSNTLLVVNNGVNFSAQQQALFFATLAKHLPGYQLWPLASLEQAIQTRLSDLPANTSLLVLNPVDEDANNSIRQFDDENIKYADFFDAYITARKEKDLRWDIYTHLKIDRLNGWLDQQPLTVVLQGMNLDQKMLGALDYINELKTIDPDKYNTDLAKPRSRLKTLLGLVNNKISRTKTELWFKESLLTQISIPLPDVSAGRYTAFSVRVKKKSITLLGYLELKIKNGSLQVLSAGVTEGDLDWLVVEHPALSRLDKLFNDSFYLYDHRTDALLTSYTSARVPRIIGPAAFNVVDSYRYQEQEKASAERNGQAFKDYTITRSAKAEQNVLPYLLSPGRSVHDPLTKSQKMKHHHIYIQPHDQGLYLLISDAQPANTSMARSNLVENLLIWNKQGKALEVFSHPLTGVYLNSFTLDMLRSGNSSKSSIFAKLARLMVEN